MTPYGLAISRPTAASSEFITLALNAVSRFSESARSKNTSIGSAPVSSAIAAIERPSSARFSGRVQAATSTLDQSP